MTSSNSESLPVWIIPSRWRFYYGWVTLTVAALAMVGTLPGRTQGLGLITEPLLRDLQIDRVLFAQINLWATLLGSLLCLGIGRLLDRFGSRIVLTVVSLLLGVIVYAMSRSTAVFWIAVLITLSRGFGQSALSVVSLTIVGQWFIRRLSMAMGIYSILLSIGFMVAFPVVGAIVLASGWRTAWSGIAFALLAVLAPASWLFVRRSPESCGETREVETENSKLEASNDDYTLGEALSTPAFWVVSLASSVYGLIASGIALFNESILAERGFDASTYHRTLVVTALTALAGNFAGGWLSTKVPMTRLMAAAMVMLSGALMVLPRVHTHLQVVVWAIVMGAAGGIVIVVFFSFWSRTFGRRHLGKIQGAAQTMTVIASAVGPLLLAQCVVLTGSYGSVFYALALVVATLAVSSWMLKKDVRKL